MNEKVNIYSFNDECYVYLGDYKKLKQENQRLQERINIAIEYIRNAYLEVLKYNDEPSETTSYEIVTVDLLKILEGE